MSDKSSNHLCTRKTHDYTLLGRNDKVISQSVLFIVLNNVTLYYPIMSNSTTYTKTGKSFMHTLYWIIDHKIPDSKRQGKHLINYSDKGISHYKNYRPCHREYTTKSVLNNLIDTCVSAHSNNFYLNISKPFEYIQYQSNSFPNCSMMDTGQRQRLIPLHKNHK